jgi:hypothetical protein
MAFAIQSGDFSATTTWDTGVVPTDSEDAYSNGFTIQVGGTIISSRLRNDGTTYLLPGMPIPVMISNTAPSGQAFASTQATGSEAWRAFDQNTSTFWATTTGSLTGVIGYEFPTARTIRRYLWRATINAANNPRNWTFEGGSSIVGPWVVLNTVTNSQIGANATFISTGLTNSNAYRFYRMNITLNNGGTNTLQVAELEMTELTGTVNGGIPGGTFNLLNDTNLTVTASTGVVVGSTVNPTITFNLSSPNSATINGDILSPANAGSQTAILHSGTGTLNMIGNHSNNSSGGRVINVTLGGVLNVTGSPNNASTAISPTYDLSSNSSINITGNLINGGSFIIYHRGTGTVNVNGNVSAGSNSTIGLVSSSNCIVSGNVTGISNVSAISNTSGAANINVTGTVTAGNGSPAITGLGAVTLTGPLINTNGFMAVNAPSLFITSATTYWSFTSSGGSPTILYTDAPTNTTGFPSSTDVRKDIVYGPTNTTIGTMNVPLPSDVRINVPTDDDDTVGTATLTSEDLFDAITASTSGVGLRLKNVATVATVGKQIASFNI